MPTIPPFTLLRVEDKDLSRVQDNIGTSLTPALAMPILNGRLVGPVVLTTTGSTPEGYNDVDTGLQATVKGWTTVRLTPFAQLYDRNDAWWDVGPTFKPAPAPGVLRLLTNVNCTATFWVF